MFRQFATVVNSPNVLFNAHPSQLAMLLERVWENRSKVGPLGEPGNRSNLPGAAIPAALLDAELQPILRREAFRWDHLIYAYMVENTRVFEIFKRVLTEFLHGEKLGTPTAQSQGWLRNTEELFFKDGAPFLITSLVSHIRGDLRGNRRNPYLRMFAMELNHGSDDGKPLPYVRADATNTDFVSTFEEFLREVWVGMSFVTATSSSNPTDPSKIATLASKLKNMLLSRRQNGNLSREEFAAVAAMSWFHLTLEFTNNNANAPIVEALRAEANGTEQRLFKIAERVGLPAHGLSKHFFDIADPISRILTQIETGAYDSPPAVAALYTPVLAVPASPESAMRQIITHWTAITGRDVKARKVTAN